MELKGFRYLHIILKRMEELRDHIGTWRKCYPNAVDHIIFQNGTGSFGKLCGQTG